VQRAPSATHAPQASVCGEGTQPCALQHSLATAHGWPFTTHALACSQRIDAPSAVHLPGPQHCGSPMQSSPSDPQLVPAHRFTPLVSATHDPEQQSALVSQRSQSGVHPPIGAQRLLPSFVATHDRVQHSPGPPHASPTTLPHGCVSFELHIGSAPQRPLVHEPEQQSAPLAQSSPVTRHASRSTHRPELEHACPQQSGLALQLSPAGAQPDAFAHVPLLHVFEQQSVPCTHDAPAVAQSGSLAQLPLVPSGAKHESEQHAPANVHV
jgi:hypothetical protein